MEQDEMAVKSKAKKIGMKKAAVEKEVAPVVIEAYGMKLTLDNSIKKYANAPFFLKKAEEADRLFASKKSDL